MAKSNNKNVNQLTTGDYQKTQENIRKAKGNPNKNVHQKKNGSNYKGYTAAKKAAEAERIAQRSDRAKMPLWVSLTMVAIFVILVVVLILMNSTFKDNAIFAQISSIVIGSCCGVLFYLRRFNVRPDSKFQKILYTVLAVMAVVYIFMGGYGLVRLL